MIKHHNYVYSIPYKFTIHVVNLYVTHKLNHAIKLVCSDLAVMPLLASFNGSSLSCRLLGNVTLQLLHALLKTETTTGRDGGGIRL